MPLKPIKILQASAGSGKTFNLAAHYLTLLFAGETRYREILAVTFTNKATEEMKSRILQVLKGLASGDPAQENFRQIILNAHTGMSAGDLQEQAYRIYRLILHDYSRFSVSTIDGFVQKIIRSFSFELGLDAGYRLEMNTAKVKRELAAKLNAQLDRKPEMLQWIINLALERIKDNKGWNYRETLLGLADEIFKERYRPFEDALKLLDHSTLFADLQELTKTTLEYIELSLTEKARAALHTFRESGVLIDELKGKSRTPLNNLVKIADGDYDKISGLQKLIDEPEEWQKGGLNPGVSALYSRLNPQIRDLFDFYRQELPQYEMAKAIRANLYYLRLMQEMAGLLKEYRQENTALLISDAQNLLKNITGGQQDNPSFIWEKTGSRYRHFLFDEFQDTSSFQWDNFLPLLKNAIAEANGILTDHLIVGDVKQSIYRWRNGDWRILLHRAKQSIGELQVTDDSLEENYRSAANIIDFNNFLFSHTPAVLQNYINDKVLNDGDETLYATWWKAGGYDDIITRAYGQSYQQKAPSTPAGGSIEINFLPVTDNRTRASEAKEEALLKLAGTLDGWIASGRYQAGQVCILVRTNGEAREVIEYLMKDQQAKAQQPNSLAGNTGLYEIISGEALLIANNTAVRLLVNTLYAMAGRQHETAVYKAACLQLYNQLQGTTVDVALWLKLTVTAPENLAGYLPGSLSANWYLWQQLPLAEIAEQLIAAYGLDTMSLHIPYLLAFRDMLSSFSAQGEQGISAFLRWWEEEGGTRALPSAEQSNAVQVMTIHKSKGLAFDVVMIPFCSWGLDGMANSIFWVDTLDTPYAMLNSVPVHYKKSLGRSAFAKAYFEELLFNFMDALNMLYVAATRTRSHLYITAPGQVPGKENQFSMAGDLISRSLELYAAELSAPFDGTGLLINEPVERKNGQPGQAGHERFTEKSWTLKTYPVSQRLNEALTNTTVYEQLDLLSGDISRRRGVILHELLARVSTVSQLPGAIKKMNAEGWFRDNEEPDILELAESVLQQPELRALLEKPLESFNEKTIINRQGQSYRPDKVLIGDDQVVLIDFKFTGEPKPQHYRQVEEYRSLLSEMGYRNISAYLYYGYLKELKMV